MIRHGIILGLSIMVFVALFFLAKGMLRTMEPHTWHRAYVELDRLNKCVDSYKDEYGEFPSEDKVNGWIKHIWEKEGKIDWGNGDDEFNAFTAFYSERIYEHLKRWDSPPLYVVSKGIPTGRGFYTMGDDNQTSSSGNDPDDINSWDRGSISYYYDRLWRQRYIQYSIIALIGSFAFAVLLYRISKPKQAQQGSAHQSTTR